MVFQLPPKCISFVTDLTVVVLFIEMNYFLVARELLGTFGLVSTSIADIRCLSGVSFDMIIQIMFCPKQLGTLEAQMIPDTNEGDMFLGQVLLE